MGRGREHVMQEGMNLGALIGGLAVLVALAVCLCCLCLAGIGPKCLTRLRLRCREGGMSRKLMVQPQALVPGSLKLAQLPAKMPTTEVPAQLPVTPAKRPKALSRPLPSVPPQAVKSAPDPPRLQPTESPVTPLSLTEERAHSARGFLKSTTLRRCIARFPRQQTNRLPTPGSARAAPKAWHRGLGGTHLSLSTIRDSGAALPPDCLYETDDYLLDRKVASTPAPQAELSDRLCQQTTVATSLHPEIGSAYGRVIVQGANRGVQGPRSNTSSSDCHDWSPPQPRLRQDVPFASRREATTNQPGANHKRDQLAVANHKRDQLAVANHKRDQLAVANHKRDQLAVANHKRDQLATANHKRDQHQLTAANHKRDQPKASRKRPSYESRFRLVNETVDEHAVWASTDGDITIFDLDVGGGLAEFAEPDCGIPDHSTSF